MTQLERAKQFSPYSALHGLNSAMRAQELLLDSEERIVLGEDAAEELNRVLCNVVIGDCVIVKYYNEKKYTKFSGTVQKIDPAGKYFMISGTCVHLRDMVEMEVI